jgi:hypothetical protein
MRYSLLIPTAVLAGALAFGCADSRSPTGVAAGPTGPAFSVDRGTQPFGFAFADDRFVLFLGLTIENVTTAVCVGGQVDVEELQALTVTRPNDGSLKTLQRGTLTLVAIELSDVPDFCADPTLAFVGSGEVLYTDNDVFVSGNRANASQIQVNGTVTDASGQAYNLTAINVTVRAPGEDPDDILNQNTKIKLNPIGS